jgi:hypothetical protein
MLSTPLAIFGLCFDPKHYKYYSVAIVLNLAFIGYYFEPLISDDLYRHFLDINHLQKMHIIDVVRMYATDPLVVKNLWFFVVSRTKISGLLPFSAVFITYYILVRDIFEFAQKERIPNGYTVSFVVMVLISWQLIWVMSGVRFFVSIALFFHGLHREFIQEKRNWATWSFYFLPLFIHYSGIILIAIRGLVLLRGWIKHLVKMSLLFWSHFAELIIALLSSFGGSYLQGVTRKMQAYMLYSNESQYMLVTKYVKLAFCILFILGLGLLKTKNRLIYEENSEFYDYGLWLSLFCIGGRNVFIIPDRFGFMVLAMLPFVFLPLLGCNKTKILKQTYAISYLPLAIMGIYLQYVPMKATNYGIAVSQFLTRNLIQLFINHQW